MQPLPVMNDGKIPSLKCSGMHFSELGTPISSVLSTNLGRKGQTTSLLGLFRKLL